MSETKEIEFSDELTRKVHSIIRAELDNSQYNMLAMQSIHRGYKGKFSPFIQALLSKIKPEDVETIFSRKNGK